jgi:hypothetical protein
MPVPWFGGRSGECLLEPVVRERLVVERRHLDPAGYSVIVDSSGEVLAGLTYPTYSLDRSRWAWYNARR